MKSDDLVLMGKIGAPHGVRGDLRVKAFTDDPLAIGDYGPLQDAEGNPFDVLRVQPAKTVVVVRFKQVTSRAKAEALNGTELFVERSRLPDGELDEDEFFITDLIGMACVSSKNERLGDVSAVENFGAGDIIEIKFDETGKRELFAFDVQTFPDIDVENRNLVFVRPGEILAREEADD
ncbi:MAG: ribosome maturation factor RimM [Pseudomonadota bacterium]